MHRGMHFAGHRHFMLTGTAPSFCDPNCGYVDGSTGEIHCWPARAPTHRGPAVLSFHSSRCRAEIEKWNAAARVHFNHFITLLRRVFPRAGVDYFKVWEVQERGALHFHMLLRLRGVRVTEDVARRLLVRAGFGYVCDLRAADGGSVAYLAKYLTKSMGATPGRVWSASRGWVEYVDSAVLAREFVGCWERPRRRQGPALWVFDQKVQRAAISGAVGPPDG
jgi:hypothetical protein